MDDPPASGSEVVVLVDEDGRQTGVLEKMRAHEAGALHRAVSVVVMDPAGRVILQQRARTKYHGAGLWSNTACGHPRPDEPPDEAARRRLREEMGIDCPLRHVGTITYRVQVGSLIEHERDDVYIGTTGDEPRPDPGEVMAWRVMDLAALRRDQEAVPERYTPWLPYVMRVVEARS